jgi:hypothetical protein
MVIRLSPEARVPECDSSKKTMRPVGHRRTQKSTPKPALECERGLQLKLRSAFVRHFRKSWFSTDKTDGTAWLPKCNKFAFKNATSKVTIPAADCKFAGFTPSVVRNHSYPSLFQSHSSSGGEGCLRTQPAACQIASKYSCVLSEAAAHRLHRAAFPEADSSLKFSIIATSAEMFDGV